MVVAVDELWAAVHVRMYGREKGTWSDLSVVQRTDLLNRCKVRVGWKIVQIPIREGNLQEPVIQIPSHPIP